MRRGTVTIPVHLSPTYADFRASPLKPEELQVLRSQYEKEGEFVGVQTKFNYAWVCFIEESSAGPLLTGFSRVSLNPPSVTSNKKAYASSQTYSVTPQNEGANAFTT